MTTSDRPIRRGEGYVEPRTRADGGVRYRARWHDGLRWRSKTFVDEDDAYDHVRAMARKRRRGIGGDASDLTVLEVVDDYLDRGTARWSQNTRATYGSIRDRTVDGPFGRRLVVDVTPAIMQHWIDRLADTYSPARIEMIRAVVGGALAEAVRLGIIDRNPAAGVRLPRSRRAEHGQWSADDIAAVLAHVRDDADLTAYYTLALTTGMRPGEIRALGWDAVDLDTGTVAVRRSMTRDANYRPIIGATTKTGRTRVIAIPDATVAALKAQRRHQAARRLKAAHWHDAGLVFDRGNGAPLPQQSIWRRHRDVCTQAGVPSVRLHDLRHVAAASMLTGGVALKTVADILGHSTISTTADIYIETGDLLRRAAADVLGEMVGGDSGENRGRIGGDRRDADSGYEA